MLNTVTSLRTDVLLYNCIFCVSPPQIIWSQSRRTLRPSAAAACMFCRTSAVRYHAACTQRLGRVCVSCALVPGPRSLVVLYASFVVPSASHAPVCAGGGEGGARVVCDGRPRRCCCCLVAPGVGSSLCALARFVALHGPRVGLFTYNCLRHVAHWLGDGGLCMCPCWLPCPVAVHAAMSSRCWLVVYTVLCG